MGDTATLSPPAIDAQKETSFSKEWWKFFYEKSKGLTAPMVIKNVLSETDITEFMDGVYTVVKDVSDRKVPNGFRLSIEGTIKDDNRDFFYNNPPLPGENIVAWCSRAFGDRKFGVILNSVQNYDRKLKGQIYRKFRHLLEQHGVPPNGIEITLFFGNYGYTPLGFHLDPVGHKVTHLHLGPGNKQMYLIGKDKFEKELAGKNGSKDFDKLVPHAEKFEFDKNDAFFMPNGYYHVGNTSELSFGLTVWHIEPPIAEFQAEMGVDLMKVIFSKEDNETILKRDDNPINDISSITSVLKDFIDIDSDFANMTLGQAMQQLMLEHRYKIFSNGYFYGFLQNMEAEIKPPAVEFKLDTVVKGVDPFIIRSLERGEKTILFVQGKKVSVPSHEKLDDIIKKLNEYKSYTIEKLFEGPSEDWDTDLILYITNELFKYNGIEFVNSK